MKNQRDIVFNITDTPALEWGIYKESKEVTLNPFSGTKVDTVESTVKKLGVHLTTSYGGSPTTWQLGIFVKSGQYILLEPILPTSDTYYLSVSTSKTYIPGPTIYMAKGPTGASLGNVELVDYSSKPGKLFVTLKSDWYNYSTSLNTTNQRLSDNILCTNVGDSLSIKLFNESDEDQIFYLTKTISGTENDKFDFFLESAMEPTATSNVDIAVSAWTNAQSFPDPTFRIKLDTGND